MSGTDHLELTDPEARRGRGTPRGDGLWTYEVTYAFRGHLRGRHETAVDRARAELSSLRGEGVAVAFRGATLDLDAAGRVVTATARFEAPDEGAVARLNYRAMLPVSGVRRCDPRDP